MTVKAHLQIKKTIQREIDLPPVFSCKCQEASAIFQLRDYGECQAQLTMPWLQPDGWQTHYERHQIRASQISQQMLATDCHSKDYKCTNRISMTNFHTLHVQNRYWPRLLTRPGHKKFLKILHKATNITLNNVLNVIKFW